MPPRSFVLPVESFRRLTRRARLLVLDASRSPFSFHAGQAVSLALHGRSPRKPYSMASSPQDLADTGTLEFLVGLDESGSAGPHLDGARRASLVDLDGPLGGFELPRADAGAPVMLVAGGTGIAPLRSLMRTLLQHPSPPSIAVVYSARSPDELAFAGELRRLARQGRIALTLTVTGQEPSWKGLRGRVTRGMLETHLPKPALARVAACGPAPFVLHVTNALALLGVPPAHITTERW